tara:strand:+ start:2627 stop:2959 length:333 start_codon:yes stop_codon:yes gene_type:complete
MALTNYAGHEALDTQCKGLHSCGEDAVLPMNRGVKAMSRKAKIVAVGDLVQHVLMDDGWLGIILEVREEDATGDTKKVAKLQIISNHRFSDGTKVGWADVDWLKIKSKVS